MACFKALKRKIGGRDDSTTPVSEIQSRPVSASEVCTVVQKYDPNNQQYKVHEKCINKQKASDHQVEVLSDAIENLKKEREKSSKEIDDTNKEHLRTMEGLRMEHQRSVEKLKENIWKQELEIQEMKDVNDELLTRLSAMAGARLTDGNANIADLSDENRPTKLAEQFSELYDNEWTDAFEVLTANTDLSEENACHTLLKALCISYIKSKEKANNDRQDMTEAMKKFLGDKEPPTEQIKQLKDMRKKNFNGHIKVLQKELKESVRVIFPEKKIRKNKGLKQFLNKALKLCWLMVIQDPPVFMDVHIKGRGGEEHNGNTLKPYTKSGQYIDYIVWPPLFLKEGGDVLGKGIAQFKSAIASNFSSEDLPKTSGNERMTSKTEQEVEEPTEETEKSKNAETSAHEVNTYQEKGETSTCRDQMPSSDTNSSSVVTPFATVNGKEPEKVDLNQKFKDEDKNNLNVDLENNITTDKPLQNKETENSEDLSSANAIVSDHGTNAGTQDINVKPLTHQETPILSEKKEIDKEIEVDIDNNSGLTDSTINKGSSTFISIPDHCNESNSKSTFSNAKPSAKEKKGKTNKTRPTKEAKVEESTKTIKPTGLNLNTSADMKNTKNESYKNTSNPTLEKSKPNSDGQNNDDSPIRYISKNHKIESTKKKNQHKQTLTISIVKAT